MVLTNSFFKPKRQRTSEIWQYSKTLIDGGLLSDKDGDTIWRCKNCSKTYKEKSGTSKPARHLAKCLQNKSTTVGQPEDDKGGVQLSYNWALDSEKLEQLYLRWVTSHAVPEEQICWPEFREFLNYVNPMANSVLPIEYRKLRLSLILCNDVDGVLIDDKGTEETDDAK